MNKLQKWHVSDDTEALRIDRFLSERAPEHSRSRWQQLIRAGAVTVDGETVKPSATVEPGMVIAAEVPEPETTGIEPQHIPLDILFEDEQMIVINKPPGLVVHPAAGHRDGTLVNALLAHCPDLEGIGGERRPGIVHRLDKDTSGVMVAAKTETAMRQLKKQFLERNVTKIYRALVRGCPEPPVARIETEIGHSATHRRRMSVNAPNGRRAVTHYRVVETYAGAALLEVRIETGRTHQIRVHMSYRGHPVLGDREYGRGFGSPAVITPARQLLHAWRLSLNHPVQQVPLEFEAPLPQDMQQAIQQLRNPELK